MPRNHVEALVEQWLRLEGYTTLDKYSLLETKRANWEEASAVGRN